MPSLLSAVRSVFVGQRRDNGPPLNFARNVATALPELLESRTHLSVARDADGWTVVTPERDSRVVYVSSSGGNDENGGRSPEAAVASIARGAALIRNNSSDQLLLKRGDVWQEAIGGWWKSGKSEQEPILIGAYGAGERPRLNTGTEGAFNAGKSARDRIDHVSLIGLHLSAHARLPGPDFVSGAGAAGVRVLAPTDDFLIEDCRIEGYKDNVVLQAHFGPLTDVTVRRSVIVDAYSIDPSHAQGLYASGVDGLLIEENVFDHNGWMEGVPGAAQTPFNHNVYVQWDSANVVVRGNVFANASSHGLQARSGGRVEDNLFLDNPIGMSFGLVNGATATPGGVAGLVNGNVFLGARRIGGAGRGWGVEVGNVRAGAATLLSNNVFAAGGEHARGPAIVLAVGADVQNAAESVGINDLTVRDNVVYDWPDGIRVDDDLKPGTAGPDALNGLVVRDNDFQRVGGRAVLHDTRFGAAAERWSGNRYDPNPTFSAESRHVTWERWARDREPTARAVNAAYAEPGRTAAAYSASLGGEPSTAAFVAAARAQSSQGWRPQYTAAAAIAYSRDGYAEGGVARDWSPAVGPAAAAHLPALVRLAGPDAPLAFDVAYADATGVDAATLDGGDVRLIGRRGFDAPAALVGVRHEGGHAVATYAVAPPEGGWGRGNRGTFTLVVNAGQVRDAEGHATESGELAEFKLAVSRPARPAAPDRPPTVTKLTSARRGPSAVTARFSEDVSASIGAEDLFLLAADGSRVDPATIAVAYDPGRNAATWTFPGLPGGALPEGKYRPVLPAWAVTDAAGQMLDGNRDRAPGDDFAPAKPLRVI